jgi:hypothetical protein
MKILDFFRKYMGKMVGAGAGAEIFDKLEPEPTFLTSRSRSRAAQKWTGSATLVESAFDSGRIRIRPVNLNADLKGNTLTSGQ